MFLAFAYVIGGLLLGGFVIWLLVAGGEPLHRYLDEQTEVVGNGQSSPWTLVFVLLGVAGMMIFFGLRTLLGQEGRMSRLAELRGERDFPKPKN